MRAVSRAHIWRVGMRASGPCDPVIDGVTFSGVVDSKAEQRVDELFELDQKDRQTEPIDWSRVSRADRERRREVLELLQAGRVNGAESLYAAAFIFQHGDCPDHYRLANELAKRSIEAGYDRARWIYAATLDRYLLSTGERQKFGTQYLVVRGRWQLQPLDPATTDEERALYHVPPLVEIRAREGQ